MTLSLTCNRVHPFALPRCILGIWSRAAQQRRPLLYSRTALPGRRSNAVSSELGGSPFDGGLTMKQRTFQHMKRALYCLVPEGDSPDSSRLFDAIAALCVPVVISAGLHVPVNGSQPCKVAAFARSNVRTL